MANYIVGRNAVLEYLRGDGDAEKLFLLKGERKGSVHKIVALAKEKGLIIAECDREKLDELAEGQVHQGVALFAQDYRYATVEEMLSGARAAGHAPLLILLDEVTDPHNLGAIIRSAECAGADGVIIPKRRSATVTSVVHKSAAGATTYVKVARVNNLNAVIDRLKKENIWVYGAAGEAPDNFWDTDLTGGIALVVGSEGRGLSRLTAEKCDGLVSIPLCGKIESLNASAATAVLLYEVLRQRRKGKA